VRAISQTEAMSGGGVVVAFALVGTLVRGAVSVKRAESHDVPRRVSLLTLTLLNKRVSHEEAGGRLVRVDQSEAIALNVAMEIAPREGVIVATEVAEEALTAGLETVDGDDARVVLATAPMKRDVSDSRVLPTVQSEILRSEHRVSSAVMASVLSVVMGSALSAATVVEEIGPNEAEIVSRIVASAEDVLVKDVRSVESDLIAGSLVLPQSLQRGEI